MGFFGVPDLVELRRGASRPPAPPRIFFVPSVEWWSQRISVSQKPAIFSTACRTKKILVVNEEYPDDFTIFHAAFLSWRGLARLAARPARECSSR